VLVVAQIAISVALLIGSGLLIRTMANLTTVDLGFRPERLLGGAVEIQEAKYPSAAERAAFYATVLERVRALPGVISASTVSKFPIASTTTDWPIWRSDQARPPGGGRTALSRWASPGYFETMGMPLLKGRDIAATDTPDSQRVIVVSEHLAEGIFGEEDPIGQTVKIGWTEDIYEVIGVVGNARIEGVRSNVTWAMYTSAAQMQATFQWIAVRTEGDPLLLEDAIRNILDDLDPEVLFSQVTTMEAAVDGNLSGFRTVMLSLGLLAGVALLLTSVGLYGVLAYNVSQRANEFGVRLALGAPAAKMLSLVLNKGFQLVVAGLALGIVGSLIGTRMVEQLLYETDRLDPFSFVGAAAFLAGVALIACIIPAWRAIRISPVEVLRRE
jgi:putative ABC transport system permease protein